LLKELFIIQAELFLKVQCYVCIASEDFSDIYIVERRRMFSLLRSFINRWYMKLWQEWM